MIMSLREIYPRGISGSPVQTFVLTKIYVSSQTPPKKLMMIGATAVSLVAGVLFWGYRRWKKESQNQFTSKSDDQTQSHSESPTRTQSRSSTLSYSESSTLSYSEIQTQNRSPSQIRSQPPSHSESQSPTRSESLSPSPSESESTSPSEGQSPTPMEIQTPSPVESPVGTPSQSPSQNPSLSPVESQSSSPVESQSSSPVESQSSSNDVEVAASSEPSIPASRLGEFLICYRPNRSRTYLQPRGLKNSGNFCYAHSTLQALLSVPQFVNLLHDVSNNLDMHQESIDHRSMPITSSMIEVLNQYLENNSFDSIPAVLWGVDANIEEVCHEERFQSLALTKLHSMLSSSRDFSDSQLQHDAEELMTFILDRLNSEIVNCITQLINSNEDWQQPGDANPNFADGIVNQIFNGTIRSVIKHNGISDSVNMETYKVLRLAITCNDVVTVEEALRLYALGGEIEVASRTEANEVVMVRNERLLHKLPEVLIIQLKRFSFDRELNRALKVNKRIIFQLQMSISEEVISEQARITYERNGRCYTLVSVVRHIGAEAINGHYICDAFHRPTSCWLRYDDGFVMPITIDEVRERGNEAYILFYLRCDTLVDENSGPASPPPKTILRIQSDLIAKKEELEQQKTRVKVPTNSSRRA